MPALSILQAANVATPEEAACGFVVHVSAAPAVPVAAVIARVIEAVLLATGIPLASSTVTAGCAAHAVPPVPPPGCAVNASLAATPKILKALLVALVIVAVVASVAWNV